MIRGACTAPANGRALLPAADVAAGTPADIGDADIVVCATTAPESLFAADAVPDRAVVVAVGSHEPSTRELPAGLLARGQVIVEGRRVAAAEAGDVILAAADGVFDPASVVPMKRLFTGTATPAVDRPRVVKTCGMGWQDLVVARLAVSDDAKSENGERR